MIDEKKLIEKIKERIKMHKKDYQAFKNYSGDRKIKDIAKRDECTVIIDLIKSQPKVGEWIPCSDRLPEDYDNRFYMCTVENHEDDPPMFCQYEEEYGFGFWNDIYDEHTLGFVDSEFRTNEELGCEKVIAWMPLPEPYKEIEK